MMTSGERITARMKELGLSQAKVAALIPTSRSTVFAWMNDNTQPTGDRLVSLSKALSVSTTWLLTGEQPPTQMVKVHSWDSATPMEDDEVAIPFYKDFLLACGSGATGEALKSETRRLRLSLTTLKAAGVEPENAVAMTAFGNSNFPDIKDKATVYVDLGFKKIIDGCVYAIDHGGVFKFKYLYNLPKGGIRIVSKNEAEYPEERLSAEEAHDQEFNILGYAFDVQNPLPRRF